MGPFFVNVRVNQFGMELGIFAGELVSKLDGSPEQSVCNISLVVNDLQLSLEAPIRMAAMNRPILKEDAYHAVRLFKLPAKRGLTPIIASIIC